MRVRCLGSGKRELQNFGQILTFANFRVGHGNAGYAVLFMSKLPVLRTIGAYGLAGLAEAVPGTDFSGFEVFDDIKIELIHDRNQERGHYRACGPR